VFAVGNARFDVAWAVMLLSSFLYFPSMADAENIITPRFYWKVKIIKKRLSQI
jgi:hypothetical protein